VRLGFEEKGVVTYPPQRHLDGLKLVNRIGLLLNTKNGKAVSNRYGNYVQKQLAKIPPLDPVADSAALRALATALATPPQP
jgi:hypothetical protein